MKKLLCAIALMLVSTVANAATVTFTVDLTTPGQWNLYANSSSGDNAGLAGYGVVLTGAVGTLTHQSIRILDAANADESQTGPVGFTLLRSPNGAANTAIGAGQDNITPTPFLVKGWGQTSGSFAANFPGITANSAIVGGTWTQFPAPAVGTQGDTFPGTPLGALIAGGTLVQGGLLGIDSVDARTFANVFAGSGTNTQAATVQTRVIVGIPEPATLGLVGMGLVGLAGLRRRKA